MKVLFANKFFFRKGGAEAVMFDEIDILKTCHVDVAEFAMLSDQNRPSQYSSYFVSEKSYRSGSRAQQIKAAVSFIHSREAVTNITRLIRDEMPDILHCHNIYHQLTPSIIRAASRLKVPIVLTLHDYKTVCPIYTRLRGDAPCTACSGGRFEHVLRHRCAGGSLARSALLWAEARYHAAVRSYERVTRFIAPSRFMREAVAGRLGEDNVVYIPNGIDTTKIDVSHEDEGYVLFLGRLAPEKGLETLLQAHAADQAFWRLVIAGTGPLLDDLRCRFPRAEFTGHLEGERLKAKLRAASVIVVPSESHENAPISVLEAMAHRKAVVASRIGGIPEMVRHGRSGLLFEPKNAGELSRNVRALLADRHLRDRLGAEARRVVESEYSIQRHVAMLLSLYHSLIPAPRGPPHERPRTWAGR